MRSFKVWASVAILSLLVSVSGYRFTQAQVSTQTGTMDPGTSVTVNCPTRLVVVRVNSKTVTLKCNPAAGATPTAQPTRTQAPPTATAIAPTATRVSPTATAVAPTATHVHPTATTPPSGGGLDPVPADVLGACPASVHDRYAVTGPDGKLYRTWHPQTVAIDPANASAGTCAFAHEHGDDPTTSQANSSLPAFEYVSKLMGMDEPHAGFKVFVVNRNTVNDEGRTAKTSTRIVAHMGTGGVKRFTQSMHTLMFDLVAPDGHFVHVQGMADTALAGSICQRDARLGDNDPNNDIGRTVVFPPGNGCDLDSLYEIWLFHLNIADKVTVLASTAAFDPITVMNPNDPNQTIYTRDVFPQVGDQFGCNREGYHGPVYWYNSGGPTVYHTDVMGNPGGPIRQEISTHSDIGIPMSEDQTQFKFHRATCAPGLGLKN